MRPDDELELSDLAFDIEDIRATVNADDAHNTGFRFTNPRSVGQREATWSNMATAPSSIALSGLIREFMSQRQMMEETEGYIYPYGSLKTVFENNLVDTAKRVQDRVNKERRADKEKLSYDEANKITEDTILVPFRDDGNRRYNLSKQSWSPVPIRPSSIETLSDFASEHLWGDYKFAGMLTVDMVLGRDITIWCACRQTLVPVSDYKNICIFKNEKREHGAVWYARKYTEKDKMYSYYRSGGDR